MLTKRLLLLGGGHTHALLIKRLAMDPISHLEVVLVSPHSLTAYSGMLPGHLAGAFTYEEIHIDLVKLCALARVKYLQAAAIHIDKLQRKILFSDRPPLSFDVLSINVGSEPAKKEWGYGIKPMATFFDQWPISDNVKSIAIIGGGAGGIEVALNLANRFSGQKKISLLHRHQELLPQAPLSLRNKIAKICLDRKIQVFFDIHDPFELAHKHDFTIWTTAAKGLDLFRKSDLDLDERGFLLTDEFLRCRGEPHIFAVGDCAHIEGQYRPRSGVYAVRLARPLELNLRNLFSSKPLVKTKLPKHHLALITTGDQRAIALWGPFYWQSPWLWRLKNRIDRRFMQKFSKMQVQPMKNSPEDMIRCLGCGSKIEGKHLKSVLGFIALEYPEVFRDAASSHSLGMSEDVALVETHGWVMQSLDYFPAFIDDPYFFGKIACLHAAGDLLAKGGLPLTCLALAVLPFKAPALLKEELYLILAGIASILQTMGTHLIGGHSAEGKQLAIGLQLQGSQPLYPHWKPKSGLKPGDSLVLTKGLGTGIILAGLMKGHTSGPMLEKCIRSMLLNHVVLLALISAEAVHAATDVTGFGFIGHLAEMVSTSRVKVQVKTEAIPFLFGSEKLLELGVSSTLAMGNIEYAESLCQIKSIPLALLLADPQTSGGFLLSMPAVEAEQWVRKAKILGFADCAIVGEVREGIPEIFFE